MANLPNNQALPVQKRFCNYASILCAYIEHGYVRIAGAKSYGTLPNNQDSPDRDYRQLSTGLIRIY